MKKWWQLNYLKKEVTKQNTLQKKRAGKKSMNKNMYIVIALRLPNIVLTKNCDIGKLRENLIPIQHNGKSVNNV